MTHDERWLLMWKRYMDFLSHEKRCPSKYNPEERPLVNWAKHNRKLQNRAQLSPRRQQLFAQLTAEASRYRRVNQYAGQLRIKS